MSQIIFIPLSVAVSTTPAYVQDVLDRITAADVAAGNSLGLQAGVVTAIADYLTGMVSAGYLVVSNNVISQSASPIKFLSLLFCARTRQGSVVPVVGPASTLLGTAAGWNYSQRNGLAGNGTDNYINTNHNNNVEGSTKIMSVVTTAENTSAFGTLIGGRATASDAGQSTIYLGTSNAVRINVYPFGDNFITAGARSVGFYAAARPNATQVQSNASGTTTTVTSAIGSIANYVHYILARNDRGNPNDWSPAATRVILPCVGTYINPTDLRARQLAFRDAVWAVI
jgi:hypothetical protein